MTDQEIQKHLANLVAEAEAALAEAEQFADEHGLTFSFEPAYGMGWYYDGEEGEWNASSQSC